MIYWFVTLYNSSQVYKFLEHCRVLTNLAERRLSWPSFKSLQAAVDIITARQEKQWIDVVMEAANAACMM